MVFQNISNPRHLHDLQKQELGKTANQPKVEMKVFLFGLHL